MNKRIAKTLLILCIAYMIGYYVLKFVFPEKLLLVVTDENILRLGNFIDSNILYKYALNIVSSFLTFVLFIFASTGRCRLRWQEFCYTLVGTAICFLCGLYLPSLYTHTSISVMFLLALLCKGKMLYTVSSFVIHGYLSQFLFSIRGFETILQYYTTVTGIVFTIEGYMWLLILSLFYNLKEKNNYEHVATISK
jgi:hypothetical protein